MAIYDLDGNLLSTEELKRIRILEYNVGNFNGGATGGYTGDDLNDYIARWNRFIGKQSADLALITESRNYIDSGNTASSSSRIYTQVFNHVLDDYVASSGNWGRALLSNAVMKHTDKITFTAQQNSSSGYVGALININDVDVYVASVHFVHDGTNATATRIAQMQELVTNIANYENAIVGGDLNTTDLTELATLQSAGFTFGNGGAFGTVNSFSVSNPAYPLDNVGVRGSKLKLRSFEVLSDITLSDHMPTITEILVG